MDFDTARAAKFEKGRREHGDTWSADHINVRGELRGELLDLYNYSLLLLDDKALALRIQLFARDTWHELV
jgi:hypothetical protein